MPSFFIKLQYFIYLVMKMNLLNRTQNLFVFLQFKFIITLHFSQLTL